jgi:hypothetical protein
VKFLINNSFLFEQYAGLSHDISTRCYSILLQRFIANSFIPSCKDDSEHFLSFLQRAANTTHRDTLSIEGAILSVMLNFPFFHLVSKKEAEYVAGLSRISQNSCLRYKDALKNIRLPKYLQK